MSAPLGPFGQEDVPYFRIQSAGLGRQFGLASFPALLAGSIQPVVQVGQIQPQRAAPLSQIFFASGSGAGSVTHNTHFELIAPDPDPSLAQTLFGFADFIWGRGSEAALGFNVFDVLRGDPALPPAAIIVHDVVIAARSGSTQRFGVTIRDGALPGTRINIQQLTPRSTEQGSNVAPQATVNFYEFTGADPPFPGAATLTTAGGNAFDLAGLGFSLYGDAPHRPFQQVTPFLLRPGSRIISGFPVFKSDTIEYSCAFVWQEVPLT